jgi:26S proteasome regulatory subunit N6
MPRLTFAFHSLARIFAAPGDAFVHVCFVACLSQKSHHIMDLESQVEAQMEKAEALSVSDPAAAVAAFREVVKLEIDADDIECIRYKEQAIHRLGDVLCRLRRPDEIAELLLSVRPFFGVLPKAKTAKIARKLFDQIFLAGASSDKQASVCNTMITWAREEKQTFLRHRLQHRLAQVLHERNDAVGALAVIGPLLKEVRRLEDRSLLVDTHLLECKIYFSIKNRSKASAALVAARTTANSIYCPPLQQAEIDMQSGVQHADARDMKTAFSYLYEAFEGYRSLGDHSLEARRALQYMVLAKILCDVSDELRAVLNAKNVLEYSGRDTDALREIADAYKKKDTHSFNTVRAKYTAELADPIAQQHLDDMYDQLLESHLMRLIEPYNRVQISFLADGLKLPDAVIEARLSQMILDKKLLGIVDQQHMCLVVFEEEHPTALYKEALTAISNLDSLVDVLFEKVDGKFDHLAAAAEEEKKKKTQKKSKPGEKAADKEKADEKK